MELPFKEPVGVDVPVVVEASVSPLLPFALADCFAAFSASRFCFDAEGAMVVTDRSRKKRSVAGDGCSRSRETAVESKGGGGRRRKEGSRR